MDEGNISDDAVRVFSTEHHVDVVRGVVQRLHHLVVRVEEPFGDGERHGVFLAQFLDPGVGVRRSRRDGLRAARSERRRPC